MLGWHLSVAVSLSFAVLPGAAGGGIQRQTGGAFTRRPDRLGRRLTLEDLQEHFSAQQEAADKAARASNVKERAALEDASAAVSRTLQAAVGADEGFEPDLAVLARRLEAAAAAKRVAQAVRLANEAAAMAARIKREIALKREIRRRDDDEAILLLL